MNKVATPEVWETPEAQTYLSGFRELQPGKFAVVKIGGSLIKNEDQLGLISSDVAVLHSLGLLPVIVHGAGPQIDGELAKNGFNTSKNGGIRITTAEQMPHVAKAIHATNLLLAGEIESAINRLGNAAGVEGLEYIFSAALENSDDLGSVTEVIDIDLAAVKRAMTRGAVPVISSVGELAVEEGTEAVPININADIAAAGLARTLQPKKYVSLTETGAVLDADGEAISKMNLADAENAISDGHIKDGMKVKVEEGLKLIGEGIDDFVITNPAGLLTELFTSEGQGTLITGGG